MTNNYVMFKNGTSDQLYNIENIENGAFYLTTDTNKLYYGYNNKLNLLNSVFMVNTLPIENIEIGQFYYDVTNNILATYDGSIWTQINPDSKFIVQDFSSSSEIEEDTVKIIYTLQTIDNIHNNIDGKDNIKNWSANLGFKGANGITVDVEDTTVIISGTISNTTGADITDISFTAEETGGINLNLTKQITDEEGNITETVLTDNFDITIDYGENENLATIKNGKISLDVYTQEEIDEKLNNIATTVNAMEFKGIINNETELPEFTEDKIGWTYKAANSFVVDSINIALGDLIIGSTEGWVVIPSGDEAILTYKLGTDKNSIILKENDDIKNTITLESSSLEIKEGNETNQISINMVWGSF